jgi:hypothetical protein
LNRQTVITMDYSILIYLGLIVCMAGCAISGEPGGTATFGDDVAFVAEHTDVIVLTDEEGEARVAVSPSLQGRVLTSTAERGAGLSFGWINRELLASGGRQDHFNAFGGEDRFWLGPEGGQYSIYFAPGDPFDLAHWQVPAEFGWEAFEVVSQDQGAVRMRKEMELTNYAGTRFDLLVDREVRVLDGSDVLAELGAPEGGVRVVAYESINTVTNTGEAPCSYDAENGVLTLVPYTRPDSAAEDAIARAVLGTSIREIKTALAR